MLKRSSRNASVCGIKDGTYEAKAEAADNNGFTDQVTMTVKDGKITEVNWDAVGADGEQRACCLKAENM